jgi:hypothetical protein
MNGMDEETMAPQNFLYGKKIFSASFPHVSAFNFVNLTPKIINHGS